MPTSEGVRIHKALADAGVASRRAAEALVEAGRVAVNGERAVVGQRVDPAVDEIRVDGRPLPGRPGHVYLALHKPAGVTSSAADRHADRLVVDLVPPGLRRDAARLYPVGRLDRDSEGLLLLTNDGEWAQRVNHPRHAVEREYAVGLREPLSPDQARILGEGIALEEGLARVAHLRPASGVEIDRMERLAGRSPVRLAWYRAVLTQGWRRQLRRMFAATGAPVERLVRVRIGSLRLDDLGSGQVRPLTSAERDRLAPPATLAGDRHGRGPGRREEGGT
jgi:23S rRNA pseudouridine2605 synthase